MSWGASWQQDHAADPGSGHGLPCRGPGRFRRSPPDVAAASFRLPLGGGASPVDGASVRTCLGEEPPHGSWAAQERSRSTGAGSDPRWQTGRIGCSGGRVAPVHGVTARLVQGPAGVSRIGLVAPRHRFTPQDRKRPESHGRQGVAIRTGCLEPESTARRKGSDSRPDLHSACDGALRSSGLPVMSGAVPAFSCSRTTSPRTCTTLTDSIPATHQQTSSRRRVSRPSGSGPGHLASEPHPGKEKRPSPMPCWRAEGRVPDAGTGPGLPDPLRRGGEVRCRSAGPGHPMPRSTGHGRRCPFGRC